ncbi:hypothetical protein LXM94_17775, partial [Rhizobium sp. TRM95111]|nr:hypothetical protein [Rhizobium alarense]
MSVWVRIFAEFRTMTTFQYSTDSTTGTNLSADDDIYIVDAGVTISVTGDDVFFGGVAFTGNSFEINGTLESFSTNYAFLLLADDTKITVSATGTVTGENITISMQGADASIVNRGSIFGTNFAIRLEGNSAFLKNEGTIDSDGTAVYISDDNGEVENLGGTISGVVGINTVLVAGQDVSIFNSGTISGTTYAYSGSAGSETLVNRGDIIGDVYLRDSNDVFDTVGGTVTGSVYGGNGNDTYKVDTAGISLVETSTGGTDTIESSVSFTLADFFEKLTLTGSASNNATGNSLANTLTGNGGN